MRPLRHRLNGSGGGPRSAGAKVPAPQGDPQAPLKALLVDAWYDAYLGVMILVRIDGSLRKGMRIRMMGTKPAMTSTVLAFSGRAGSR